MRLALTIHALYGGGAERLMSELANRWAAAHEVHLVTWSHVDTDRYSLRKGIRRYGLDLMKPSSSPWQGLRANVQRVTALRQTLKKIAPDFILSFSDQMNIVALQAARKVHAPVWISEHSDPRKQRLGILWEGWRRLVYPSCTGCVVLTSEIADHMSRLILADKIRIIPPAIHPQPTSNLATVPPASQTVLFVGRLSREKRLDVLINAWREVTVRLPNWELRLVGDGDERQRLQQLAAELPSVKFLGWVQDPHEHYRAASMFALSSDYEGFPVALLEAMNHGLPCVSTTSSSAIEDLNSPEKCVVEVPVHDCSKLASAILELATDPHQLRTLGARGKLRAQQFHWDQIGPRWDSLLTTVHHDGR